MVQGTRGIDAGSARHDLYIALFLFESTHENRGVPNIIIPIQIRIPTANQAVGVGCRTPRSDSARPGGIPLPGRRAPQGVGAAALRARTKSVSQAGASAHAGESTAVPLPGAQGEPRAHNGTIITEAPNLMWGTDGTKVFTLDDGWVWVFAAVEHWNAECVGWHVSKHGDRYAALEPISQGLTSLYGSVAAEVARGLLLRMDHGSQYLSDHFVNQVRFWGIKPCFAFVEHPRPTGLWSGSIELSRNRQSMEKSSETSRRSVVR